MYADVINGSPLIQFFDPFWHSVSLDDTKEVEMLKDAINMAYIDMADIIEYLSIITFYEVDKKDNRVYAHSRGSFIFKDDEHASEQGLRFLLNAFRSLRSFVQLSMARVRAGGRPYERKRRQLAEKTSVMKKDLALTY